MNLEDAVQYLNEQVEDYDKRTTLYKALRVVLDQFKATEVELTDYEELVNTVEPMPMPNGRTQVLRTADEAVNGDRNAQYGEPSQDFIRTATFWNKIIEEKITQVIEQGHGRLESLLSPSDVALFQILLKCSRQTHMNKFDNWVDIAGYAACGWDAT